MGEQVAFKSLFTKFVYKVELAVTIPIGKYLLIKSGSWRSGKNPGVEIAHLDLPQTN